MVADARTQTKVYLTTYLNNANLTKDDDSTPVTFIVKFEGADYPLTLVFFGSKNVDLVYAVKIPVSTPLIDFDLSTYGYEEVVPIVIFTINKTGITGNLLQWKAEAELRSVTETYPLGSVRTLRRMTESTEKLGGTTLYSVTYELTYTRDTT